MVFYFIDRLHDFFPERFHGAFASTMAIPQMSETPAKTSPAPTKAASR
jgi:hypothetical protein